MFFDGPNFGGSFSASAPDLHGELQRDEAVELCKDKKVRALFQLLQVRLVVKVSATRRTIVLQHNHI